MEEPVRPDRVIMEHYFDIRGNLEPQINLPEMQFQEIIQGLKDAHTFLCESNDQNQIACHPISTNILKSY